MFSEMNNDGNPKALSIQPGLNTGEVFNWTNN